MSYQIAVASSDGKVINQHFGKATQFLIFEVVGKNYQLIELKDTQPFCHSGEHEDNSLLGAVESLVGCRAVLVSQIGKEAVQILKSKDIEAFDIKDLIKSALEKLIQYYLKIDEERARI